MHVYTNFDQNPISGLGATFGDGQTGGRTDGRTDGQTDRHVTKPRSPSQSVPSLELGAQKTVFWPLKPVIFHFSADLDEI